KGVKPPHQPASTQQQTQTQKGKKPAAGIPPSSSSSTLSATQLNQSAASSSATNGPSLSPATPLPASQSPAPGAAATGGKDNLSHVPSYSQLSNSNGSGPFPMPSSHLITKRLPLNPGEAFDAHFQEKHSKKKKLSVEDFELLKVVGKGSFG